MTLEKIAKKYNLDLQDLLQGIANLHWTEKLATKKEMGVVNFTVSDPKLAKRLHGAAKELKIPYLNLMAGIVLNRLDQLK